MESKRVRCESAANAGNVSLALIIGFPLIDFRRFQGSFIYFKVKIYFKQDFKNQEANINSENREKTHHSQDSHQVYRYGVLLDPLCNQLHQQHEHVVDPLVNLCAPFVHGTAGQQLVTMNKTDTKEKVGTAYVN